MRAALVALELERVDLAQALAGERPRELLEALRVAARRLRPLVRLAHARNSLGRLVEGEVLPLRPADARLALEDRGALHAGELAGHRPR